MTATSACHKLCAGGHTCGCNGAVPHELHICRNPHCPCYTAEAYGDELTRGRRGDVYVPAGTLLVEPKAQP